MSKVWINNPAELFKTKNLRYFIPTEEMTYVEKINAITRFIIYGSILLYLVKGDNHILLIPIVSMIIMYFLITWGSNLDELKETFGNKENISCQNPDNNNPFMNILPVDDRDRLEACKYNEETKEKIDNNFNTNLYLDLNDIYGKNNSQRQFYTMPSTTIPNKQHDFAEWLYNSPNTCKEGNC
tara:strand:+ start:104 stop:652 length:549 start_codon:yes stop_codon:yes gene_type:complete